MARHGEVLTEHVGAAADVDAVAGAADRSIHARDMRWLESADAVVAEVTVPSLGVGYELARAEAMGKPVLCLFRPAGGRALSAMIAGAPGLRVVEYATVAEAALAIANFFAEADAGRSATV